VHKHGVLFEQAAEAFFDPFLRVMESGTTEEHRDALLGLDTSGRLLFVVHIEQDEDTFRIISARKATTTEKSYYENAQTIYRCCNRNCLTATPRR